jgi:hypothetical protein
MWNFYDYPLSKFREDKYSKKVKQVIDLNIFKGDFEVATIINNIKESSHFKWCFG